MTEINNLPPVIEAPLVDNPATAGPKPKTNFQLILIIILSLALISLGFVYAYSLGKQKQEISINNDPTPVPVLPTIAPTVKIVPSSSPTSTTDSSDFGNLTWLSSPKKITNPSILLSTTSPDTGISYLFSDLGTYQVGNFSNGASLLIVFVQPDMPSPPYIFRLISDKNKYYLIESLISADHIKKSLDTIFDKSKTTFISYQIKDLYPENFYSVNQMNFSKITDGYSLPQFITAIKDFSTAATTPIGDMLVTYNLVYGSTDIATRNYYLKLKDSTLVPYIQPSLLSMTDNRVPLFTLLNSAKNTNVFDPLRVGCGGGGSTSIVKNSSLLNDKALIGNDGNTQIFQIKNPSSALVKYLYDSYKQGRDYPSAPPVLSIDQFAQSPNHILYQEKTGDWVLMTNPDFSVQAECGKPVIYLYPTIDTQVSVKVGANITVSEPVYPQDGWTVLAHPNGQLDYQNHSYPNLFWEGTGRGIYANHAGEGFVVPQSKLIFAIKSQLRQQGLNPQEITDFMDFWQSKLPSSPFVRLTWLNTADMNQLAPLSVNPRPDTVIRIFLEFEGLDEPIHLTPQKFSAPKRLGFTLVEWGGLLLSP